MPEAVTWRYDATSQPWLRALFLAGVGLLYGVPLLVVGGALGLVGGGGWYVAALCWLFAVVFIFVAREG